jgi:prevent-host-death family protein
MHMMSAVLNMPEELPSRPASQVKNRWGEVVRQVRESGSVAVTQQSSVEMVLVDIATYRKLAESSKAAQAREQALIDQLDSGFAARLAALQSAQTPERVDALMAARGKLKKRAQAGASF